MSNEELIAKLREVEKLVTLMNEEGQSGCSTSQTEADIARCICSLDLPALIAAVEEQGGKVWYQEDAEGTYFEDDINDAMDGHCPHDTPIAVNRYRELPGRWYKWIETANDFEVIDCTDEMEARP